MCITLASANLSKTVIYAAEVQHDDEVYHVLGYQNKVVSKSGPNAMILPIPAKGALGPQNIVDTLKFKGILDDYSKAVSRLVPARRSFGEYKSLCAGAGYQVFDSGSYTIALADRPVSMRLALEQVPVEKRPEIPGSFLVKLNALYKDWPIAICCFNGDLPTPEPLLWWFKPRNPDVLFAPAIDAHDGHPPNPESRVDRDHTVIFASYQSELPKEQELSFSIMKIPVEHKWMFLSAITGRQVREQTLNGDFVFPIKSLRDSQCSQYLKSIPVVVPLQRS